MSESTPFKLDYDQGADSPRDDASQEFIPSRDAKAAAKSRIKDIVLLLSIISNIVIALLGGLVLFSTTLDNDNRHNREQVSAGAPELGISGLNEEVLMPVRYGWEYYADTVAKMDQVDRNWDNLNPDVGVLSFTRQELKEWGVQELADDPSSPDRALVWIRSSHSMHCLKVIRHTMLELAKGENLTMTFGHSMHCLGGLLRDIVCYADSSLPLKGDNAEGEYQYVRKCRNWAAMSEWAAERTACINTGVDGILNLESQNLGTCAKNDGVLLEGLSLPANRLDRQDA